MGESIHNNDCWWETTSRGKNRSQAILRPLNYDDVVDYVLATPTSYKGELKDNELECIIEAVMNANTISEDDKELILEDLNG